MAATKKFGNLYNTVAQWGRLAGYKLKVERKRKGREIVDEDDGQTCILNTSDQMSFQGDHIFVRDSAGSPSNQDKAVVPDISQVIRCDLKILYSLHKFLIFICSCLN